MLPHLSCDVGDDFVTALNFDSKPGVCQGLRYRAFDFKCFFFLLRHKYLQDHIGTLKRCPIGQRNVPLSYQLRSDCLVESSAGGARRGLSEPTARASMDRLDPAIAGARWPQPDRVRLTWTVADRPGLWSWPSLGGGSCQSGLQHGEDLLG